MRAAVEDVHQRHGQDVRVRAAQVLVQRQVGGRGGSVGNREGDAEDGVGAELALVGGAVKVDHGLVDAALVGRVETGQGRGDLVDDGVDGLLDALAEVAALVAVAQFNGLVFAGGGAGGNCCAADLAVGEQDFNFYGRVATGIEDFAGVDGIDKRHGYAPLGEAICRESDCLESSCTSS